MQSEAPKEIHVKTQAEFDACVKAGNIAIVTEGVFNAWGIATVHASDSATVYASDIAVVHAWGSATVHASGSATVHASDSAAVHASGSAAVHAWGSATVHAWGIATVRASGSATVHAWGIATVRASGSATVHASDSATVYAWGSATVYALARAIVRLFSALKIEATAQVVIYREPGARGDVTGGHVVQSKVPVTATGWCEEYGIEERGGVAIVYKALNEDFTSPHGMSYAPGTTPVAPDWDGGVRECGGGLHFSPTPSMALTFHDRATKFMACPVALSDMRVPHPDDVCPSKIKARACCAPVYEVDINGRVIAPASEAA